MTTKYGRLGTAKSVINVPR